MTMYVQRRKPDSYDRFHNGLAVRGYHSYQEYLASPEWQQFKDWYFKSGLPTKCLICGSNDVVLHHWNYDHIGFDEPGDVVPLCGQHHTEAHQWMARTGTPCRDIVKCLVECFGKTDREAMRLWKPFRNFTNRTPVKRRCCDCNRPLSPKYQRERCWDCLRKVEGVYKPKPPKVKCPKCLAMRRANKMRPSGVCAVCERKHKRKTPQDVLLASQENERWLQEQRKQLMDRQAAKREAKQRQTEAGANTPPSVPSSDTKLAGLTQ